MAGSWRPQLWREAVNLTVSCGRPLCLAEDVEVKRDYTINLHKRLHNM